MDSNTDKTANDVAATFRTIGNFFRRLGSGKKFFEALDETITEAIAEEKNESAQQQAPAPAETPKTELRAVK